MREEIKQIVEDVGCDRQSLIPILQRIQKQYNHLPPEVFKILPEITNMTVGEISSVVTFYRGFRLKPAGEHAIKVCIGTACHVKGADKVYQAFRDLLKIEGNNDTDAYGKFTVSKVACLGCCMLAVAVQIDDVIYGWVEPGTVKDVLDEFMSSTKKVDTKVSAKPKVSKGEVRICQCSSCIASGSGKIYQELEECVERLKLPVRIREVGCTGMSYLAPLMEVVVEDQFSYNYAVMEVDAVEPVLLEHFKPITLKERVQLKFTRLAEKAVSHEASKSVFRHKLSSHPAIDGDAFFSGQVRLATHLSGVMEPCDLESYRESGGFNNLCKVLSLPRKGILDEIISSGLRGRGGGGFPTGEKWQQVFDQNGDDKYIICNADEGDPGAFMDRMLLESFPFRIVEGIIVGAYTIGAREGFIYVREEYPLAVKRLQEAIKSCENYGLLGTNILGTEFSFKLNVVEGAGAFVCGEETALIASLEGKRGMPTFRPPYPSECGFKGKPTLINNVETYALIPWIVEKGAGEFAELGTGPSKGTKTFALAGKVKCGGLIEVPMGMTLRQIVYDIGGGLAGIKRLKAVQVGGPSGGCVPESMIDLPVDYEALQQSGAIMGSGGMVVLDEDDCMVDIARYFLEFTHMESCGKCTCCRVGTVLMLEILQRICSGSGKLEDLGELETIGRQMQLGSICGLGRTAANPVLSTLRYFREEYEAHLAGKCPAGKCSSLIRYDIGEKCIGCTKCSQKCPVEAIEFTPFEQHEIDQEKCVKCGVCKACCPQNAIEVI